MVTEFHPTPPEILNFTLPSTQDLSSALFKEFFALFNLNSAKALFKTVRLIEGRNILNSAVFLKHTLEDIETERFALFKN